VFPNHCLAITRFDCCRCERSESHDMVTDVTMPQDVSRLGLVQAEVPAYRFDITPPARRKDWTLVPSQPRFQIRLNRNLP
jgi:hypothetical protein